MNQEGNCLKPVSRHRAAAAYQATAGLAGGADRTSAALRAERAQRYAYVVESECSRWRRRLPGHLDYEDLRQEARGAFWWAVNRLEPESEETFPAYARLRVRGAILNWLTRERKASPTGMPTAADMRRAIRSLARSLRREPTEEEVASSLGVSLERLLELRDSLPAIELSPFEVEYSGTDPVAGEAWSRALQARVATALESLPESERRIISLVYFDELTVREIGALLGLGRSSVSRGHHRALLKLQGALADLETEASGTGRPVRLELITAVLLSLGASGIA